MVEKSKGVLAGPTGDFPVRLVLNRAGQVKDLTLVENCIKVVECDHITKNIYIKLYTLKIKQEISVV